MRLVVDANILFSALISRSATLYLITDGEDELFAPEYLLDEFFSHRTEILSKSKIKPEHFDEIFTYLKERITVVPKEEYAAKVKIAANVSPDPADVPYLALALKLECKIWSNDRILKEKQNKIKVLNTADLIRSRR